ncbi:NADPH-dependent FMN reductase family protein [Limnochorda pilosa]|uniref:Flavodoxin-like domain-containing protein n=1 Tax=Limnochorda pilosa TaxID=1555112 RepID=A0A0K2SJ29_LIMPI|nr:hypothetical protein [Limnochorda pilosa]BAS27108.1 hypothetical protein LIP_1251 [Limnochorda pilosa]
MRALVLYGSDRRLEAVAQGVAAGLEAAGLEVDRKRMDQVGAGPITTAQYQLVAVGSTSRGFLGGKVPAEVAETVPRCSRLQGKQTVAFIVPGPFGSTKTLRALMALLEKEGAWVQDFAALKSSAEAREFGSRLRNLLETR